MMPVALKVCGITRPQDLVACAELGVEEVGINLWSGSRRGLSLAAATALLHAAGLGPTGPRRIGVFVNPTRDEVLAAYADLDLAMVQVISDGPPLALPAEIPQMWVIRGTPDLATLQPPMPHPARVLLDAAVPGYGGAGQPTDWAWASTAVRQLSVLAPVWLAGGITPDNAAAACHAVAPAGLDVASGAEIAQTEHGEKDPHKIAALLAAIRG